MRRSRLRAVVVALVAVLVPLVAQAGQIGQDAQAAPVTAASAQPVPSQPAQVTRPAQPTRPARPTRPPQPNQSASTRPSPNRPTPPQPTGKPSAVPMSLSGRSVVMVDVNSSVDIAAIRRLASAEGAQVRHDVRRLGFVSLEVSTSERNGTLAALRALHGVTSARIAPMRTVTQVPDDTDYASYQQRYLSAVNAPTAWDTTRGSRNVTIAVIDTGIDTGHPDLTGKIVGQHDALGTSSVEDIVGHGTFVAGVAAATTDNNVGVAGAGFDTSILAVRVSTSDEIALDDEIDGIKWAADNGADIINLSLGSPQSDPAEAAAIEYAQAKGAVVVAAAGNDGVSAKNYPAAYAGVMSVGATDGDARAAFSNYGSWVSVAAPGVGIHSTSPRNGSDFFVANYANGDGTSFSTPIVAGEVALLKAVNPEATAADLSTAVVASTDRNSALGFGHGEVDFAAALRALTPAAAPTFSVPASGATLAGKFALTVRTSAPKAKFYVDSLGTTLTPAPVATGGGSASITFSSFGYANGTHTLYARACGALNTCGPATSIAISVINSAPTLTAPTANKFVTGSYTLSADATSGAVVAFYIDGSRLAVDSAALYSVAVFNTVPDGSHRVRAVLCSTSSQCRGPSSASVPITTKALRPAILSIVPGVFSPNADHRVDTTKVTFSLGSVSQNVSLTVLDSAGRAVRGPGSSGTRSGTFSWIWDGRRNGGASVGDGVYTVVITTNKLVNGQRLYGRAIKTVRVDRTAPTMASISGNGTTFYPYPDGVGDTFSPGVSLAESAYLTITVRNPSGASVRTVKVLRSAGRRSAPWNGRDSANRLVAAGTYYWTYTVEDSLGNHRTSSTYRVVVSPKKLTTRSWSKQVYAATATFFGTTDNSCAAASTANSYYPSGVWLYVGCADSQSEASAMYSFTLPAANVYKTLRLETYGNSFFAAPTLYGAYFNAATAFFNFTQAANVRASESPSWLNWGTASAKNRVDARHVAEVALVLTNEQKQQNDWDAKYVKLTATYQVLA